MTQAIKTLNANGTFKLEVITNNGETILIAKGSKKDWKYISVYTSTDAKIAEVWGVKYEKSNVFRKSDAFKTWVMQEQVEFITKK